jgi:hypothetical protein
MCRESGLTLMYWEYEDWSGKEKGGEIIPVELYNHNDKVSVDNLN